MSGSGAAVDDRRIRLLRWTAWLLLALGLVSCVAKGANGPKNPTLKPPPRHAVAGFGEIAFTLDKVRSVTRCALLADTPQQQRQGLMGRTDMAGYDGMLFRFHEDVVDPFYMFQTSMPLSIAWFDASGRFVSSTDMAPCTSANPNTCPTYSATGPYRYALEVPRGGLTGLGAGPGSHLSVQGACPT